jgi:GntR family transcriptional regulator/MocR family aminotransferase
VRKSSQGGLLMGFANFATAEDAVAAVRRLKAIF